MSILALLVIPELHSITATSWPKSGHSMEPTHPPEPASLLPLNLDAASAWQPALRAALHQAAAGSRLYLALQGQAAAGAPDAAQVTTLARCYNEVAEVAPRLDVVPLTPSADWCPERLAALPDLAAVLDPELPGASAWELARSINAHRPEGHTMVVVRPLDVTSNATQAGGKAADPTEPDAALQLPSDGPLQFADVAVGGTFDRLHAGHRLLLAVAALVSTRMVYIGVTSDKLLQNKKHADLLEDYHYREGAAVAFVKSVKPELEVQTGALSDPQAPSCLRRTKGSPSDPQEPTAAASREAMEALVLSQETLKGGEEINAWRRQHRFKPLSLVVVDLVGGTQGSSAASKLSSTLLREQDAQKAAAK